MGEVIITYASAERANTMIGNPNNSKLAIDIITNLVCVEANG